MLKPGLPIRIGDTAVPVYQILGNNPGPMTGPGTNTYILGEGQLVLIDPGPANDKQLSTLIRCCEQGQLRYVCVTHTHRDHSPGAKALSEATGAELIGLAAPETAGQDRTFHPDRLCQGGDVLHCGDFNLELIATPGHVSNHICYLLMEEKLLFTGDHILQGTTPVILPPDGDMSDYLQSLRSLQDLDLRYLAPGHGRLMDQPQEEIRQLIDHRLKREAKIFACLESLGAVTIDELVLAAYADVAKHLIPWAKKTLAAHLIKLLKEGSVAEQQGTWSVKTGDELLR